MKKLLYSLCRGFIKEEARKLVSDKMEGCVKRFEEVLTAKNLNSRVFIVSDDAGNRIYQDLGISEERRESLEKYIHQSVKKEKTFTQAIEWLSQKCNNPQELAYSSYRIGNLAQEQHQMISKGSSIGIDLSSMGDGGEEEIKNRLKALAKKTGMDFNIIWAMYQDWRKQNGM